MNKRYLSMLLLFCMAICLQLQAQTLPTTKITYRTTWHKAAREPMSLLLQGQQALVSLDFKEKSEAGELAPGFTVTYNAPARQYEVYTDLKTGTATGLRKLKSTQVSYQQPHQPYEWTLTDESAQIAGKQVFKAFFAYMDTTVSWINGKPDQADIKEERTTAWFCPELPFDIPIDGYSGLPGLILKLESSIKSSILFEAEKIEETSLPLLQAPDISEAVPVGQKKFWSTSLTEDKSIKSEYKKLKKQKQ